MDNKKESVVCTPGVLSGSPRLNGRRLSVFDMVNQISSGMKVEEFSAEFEVDLIDIHLALNYCRNRLCIPDNPETFCFGCVLYPMKSKETFEEFVKRLGYINYIDNTEATLKDENINFIGDLDDLREQWLGSEGWMMAENILCNHNPSTDVNTLK